MADNLIDKAILFATKAHKNVMRKGSNLPYILHPLETGVIVSTLTDDETIIAAAILHDVLEDTDTTYEELKAEFGDAADLVKSETEDKRRNLPAEATWKVRKQETINHLTNETRLGVKQIALADKLSNIRSIYRDHQTLGDALWDRFHEKRPTEQGWYYKSLVTALSDQSHTLAYQEYKLLVEKVFGQD